MSHEYPRWNRQTGFDAHRDVEYNGDKRFDITWKYGEKAEKLVGQICDLASLAGEARIEVKRKSREDGKFYVELESDPGRRGTYTPSGLSTTEADIWAFVVGGTGVMLMVRPDYLREAIKRNYGFPAKETRGSCPTKGRLLDFFDILCAVHEGNPSRAQFGDDFSWTV